MNVRVTAEGLLIPKALLDGFDEVQIRRESGRIVVSPAVTSANALAEAPEPVAEGVGTPVEEQSIFELLGKNPIRTGVTDASERHDFYIYGNPHGDEA